MAQPNSVFCLQIRVHIFPEDDYVLMYNLYPLLPGFVALPPLQLKPSATSIDPLEQNVLDELVNRYVPTHIYVLVSYQFTLNVVHFRSLDFLISPKPERSKWLTNHQANPKCCAASKPWSIARINSVI